MSNKITKVIILTIVVSMITTIFTGCVKEAKPTNNPQSDKKLSVYTSFYVLHDFANKIGGDKANVINLVKSGVDPHDWEPTPKDLINLEKADMLIYNGASMEGWIDRVLGSISNKNLITVETTDGQVLLNEEYGHKLDPHIWLDVMGAKKQMKKIRDAFIKVDELNKDYYESNYQVYSQEFDKLDKEYKDTISKLNNKNLVVTHEAFGYLCKTYGLQQIAIEGIGHESEPTPTKMAQIIKFIKDNNIKSIFFENLNNTKAGEIIAKETKIKTFIINPLESLSEKEINSKEDYFSIMRKNLQVIKTGLS